MFEMIPKIQIKDIAWSYVIIVFLSLHEFVMLSDCVNRKRMETHADNSWNCQVEQCIWSNICEDEIISGEDKDQINDFRHSRSLRRDNKRSETIKHGNQENVKCFLPCAVDHTNLPFLFVKDNQKTIQNKCQTRIAFLSWKNKVNILYCR